jgi:hypothetical protein
VLAAVQSVRGKGSVAAGQNFDRHTYGALYDDLIVSWDFDGDSNNKVLDQSGKGNDLAYINTSINTTPNPFNNGKTLFIDPTSGGSAQTGTTPGSSGPITTANLKSAPPGDFTVSFWVYPQSNIGSFEYISNQFTAGLIAGTWNFAHQNTTTFAFSVRMTTGASQAVQTDALIPGRWYHIAGTCSNNKIGLYINGKLAAPSVAISGSCAMSTRPIDVKGTLVGGGSTYPYYLDNVRIYSRALPLATIQHIYDLGDPSVPKLAYTH